MKTKLSFAQGFTLIELLVVIAIIAVLSAISVLTYRGFTDRAKDTKALIVIVHLMLKIDLPIVYL